MKFIRYGKRIRGNRCCGMSERYFSYADDTVSAAETYSEMIADKIRMLEYLSVI